MRILRTALLFTVLVSFFGCAETTPPPTTNAAVAANSLTQVELARLVSANLDVGKLMSSSLRQSVALPLHFPSVESWIGQAPEAVQIRESADRAAITTFIYLNLAGSNFSASTVWNPNKEISRSEFAFAVFDMLMRLTGKTSLAPEFVNQRSPFSDVSDKDAFYNAVMVAASRGLMSAYDRKTGEFAPGKPMQREEAVQVLNRLKAFK